MSIPNCRTGICLTLAIAALAGCSEDPVACSDEFRTLTVTVLDTAGAPAVGIALTTILQRTGETLTATSLILTPPGHYIFLDDGSRAKIRIAGDSVQVTAAPATGPATSAMYFIDVPAGCHVNKVAGPDTLIVH